MMHLNLNFKQMKVGYSEDDIIIYYKVSLGLGLGQRQNGI